MRLLDELLQPGRRSMPGAEMVSSAWMREAGGNRADADFAGDGRGRGQRDLLLAGDELQRAQEAGRIAGGEQLFRVGAGPAGAAEFARGRQRTSRTPSDEVAAASRPPVAVALAV